MLIKIKNLNASSDTFTLLRLISSLIESDGQFVHITLNFSIFYNFKNLLLSSVKVKWF